MISTWVDTASELEALVDRARAAPALAVDTEFHRERTYRPVLGLVQIAAEDWIALVDPIAVDITPIIEVFRETPLVLHAGDQDLGIFANEFRVVPQEVFDTQIAAGFLGMTSPSLASLVERRLAVVLEKGDQLSDWTRRPLSTAACEYAAADVEHLLTLAASLRAELGELGRLKWAEEECAEATQRAVQEVDASSAWWRIKGARRLRGPSAGVAQEVGVWRERLASEKNRNPRSVLPDLAYAAIVARPPKTSDDVRRLRGMEGRQHLSAADATSLLQAIERGRELPKDQLNLPPEPVRSRVSAAVVAVLSAYANQRATDVNLDPSLLATRSDITSFASGQPCRLDHGWRSELIATSLQTLLSGDASLRIEGKRIVVELPSDGRDAPAPDSDELE
ncbi:MAG: ribonuclease D [Acidimicrobiia bacterium]